MRNMVQIRFIVTLFLLISLTNNAVAAIKNDIVNLSSFFTNVTALDESFETIVKIMSSTLFDKKSHFKLSEASDISLDAINDLYKKMIVQLNFLSDKIRRLSNNSGMTIDLDASYKLFGKFNGNENELGKITIRHANSMRLRNDMSKYDESRSLKPFEDFINSVLGSCSNIREILLLNYLGLMNTATSTFNEDIMTILMKRYPDNTLRKHQLHSIYAALVRTEVQGFVTIAHAYWLRQLLGDGIRNENKFKKFSNELREIKDESIERINIYLEAVRSAGLPLLGCDPLHTALRISTDAKLTLSIYQPITSKSVIFFVKTAKAAIFQLATEARNTIPQFDIILVNGTDSWTSYIRKNKSNKLRYSSKRTPNILNENEYRGFWLKWNDSDLSVGKLGETTPLLSHSDNFAKMYFFSLATQDGPGEWIVQGATPPLDMGWCKASDGIVPSYAVHGEMAESDPMYICRAYHKGHLLPGYLIKGNNGCSVAFGGVSPITKYEILIGSEPKWVKVGNKVIPSNALVEGMDPTLADPLGICRTKLRNRMLIGKVHSSGSCWIADAQGEKYFENYEIMVGI